MKQFLTLLFLFLTLTGKAQEVAVLKYNGGGDWYSNPTALPNLIEFSNSNSKTNINKNPVSVFVNVSFRIRI